MLAGIRLPRGDHRVHHGGSSPSPTTDGRRLGDHNARKYSAHGHRLRLPHRRRSGHGRAQVRRPGPPKRRATTKSALWPCRAGRSTRSTRPSSCSTAAPSRRPSSTRSRPRRSRRAWRSPVTDDLDLVVIGAGPAGVVAALRAARLGARTALVTRDELGGMAANDGPVPVRTLAHAARLVREARQLARYGIDAGEPTLDYRRLLARVREVTGDVRAHAALRDELRQARVRVYEHAGAARFLEPHVIESDNGPRLRAGKVI